MGLSERMKIETVSNPCKMDVEREKEKMEVLTRVSKNER